MDYNKMIYDTRPVSFNEYINNNYNVLHKKLLDYALDNLFADKDFLMKNNLVGIDRKDIRIIEESANEYYEPSSISLIWKSVNKDGYSRFKKIKVTNKEMAKYWNYTEQYEDKSIEDIKLLTSETLSNAEIIYLDYINGVAKMRTRLNGIEFNVPFSFIKGDTEVADEFTLANTFTYKLNQI